MYRSLRLKWKQLTKSKSNTTSNPVELEQALCGHVLHPAGSPAHPYYCPHCCVNNILGNLKAISREWRKEGGPVAKALTHRYNKLRKAYAYFKIELVKYMWQLELFAEMEYSWEATYPGSLAGLYIQSSKTALAVARRDIPFCEVLESDLEVMAKSASKKSVCFVDGI